MTMVSYPFINNDYTLCIYNGSEIDSLNTNNTNSKQK